MENGFKELFETTIVKTIREKSTYLALEKLRSNTKYAQPVLSLSISALIITIIAVLLETWWLIIPVAISYFIYDYIKKFIYVKDLLPSIMDDVLIDILKGIEIDLEDTTEDLAIKTKANIYDSKDIKEQKDTIDMLKTSLVILKELHEEIKLQL